MAMLVREEGLFVAERVHFYCITAEESAAFEYFLL